MDQNYFGGNMWGTMDEGPIKNFYLSGIPNGGAIIKSAKLQPISNFTYVKLTIGCNLALVIIAPPLVTPLK